MKEIKLNVFRVAPKLVNVLTIKPKISKRQPEYWNPLEFRPGQIITTGGDIIYMSGGESHIYRLMENVKEVKNE